MVSKNMIFTDVILGKAAVWVLLITESWVIRMSVQTFFLRLNMELMGGGGGGKIQNSNS